MTEKQKETLAGVAVLVVLVLAIGWVLFHAFRSPAAASNGAGADDTGTPGAVTPVNPFAVPNLSINGGGDCGCGCSSAASVIPTINQMLTQGAVATNQINAMGNATLQALANMGEQEDPLLQITTG